MGKTNGDKIKRRKKESVAGEDSIEARGKSEEKS
jgi:hypothetical protein